jgi:N6-adenosine-specific RNA methylase IME4
MRLCKKKKPGKNRRTTMGVHKNGNGNNGNGQLIQPAVLPLPARKFGAILADPPWRFQNRTGKMAPEHKRLQRYRTLSIEEIKALPIGKMALDRSHLYLWVPNALLSWGLDVMAAWGFEYKGNIVWFKTRKDGGPDGRGVGFYFRNVTEVVLFGVRGSLRTLSPGRRQVNIIQSQKREHSRKPDELYSIIEGCSLGPYLELFARFKRDGWSQWGDEIDTNGKNLGWVKGYSRVSPKRDKNAAYSLPY